MARYVLPVAGAFVGYWIGGPTGAQWGWQLGSIAGSIVDPQTIKGPSIGDIAQQTSQAGVPRPIVYGLSQPIAGNVIASSAPRIVKRTQSGKGGPEVETESVFRTYAVRVCEGPIDGFVRIWRNNTLVYDARENSDLSPADNAKFLERARLFLGTYDQMPSPDLETIFGVGTTPAHRGTCYMVMADEDLTDLRGAIPQWQFQVSARGNVVCTEGGYLNEILPPWPAGGTAETDPRGPFGNYEYRFDKGGTNGYYPNDDDAGSLELALLNAVDGFDNPITLQPQLFGWNRRNDNAQGVYPHNSDIATTQYDRVRWFFFNERVAAGVSNAVWSSGTQIFNDFVITNGLAGHWWSGNTTGGVSIGHGVLYFGGFNYEVEADRAIEVRLVPMAPPGSVRDESTTFRVLQATAWAGTSYTKLPLNPCRPLGDPEYDDQEFWEAAYAEAVASGEMPTGYTYGVEYPVPQSYAYRTEGECVLVPGPIALVDIIEDICDRVGLTQYDVSQLEGLECWGITITNQYPAYAAIQALGQVFMFDGANIDGQVKFVRRGGDVVATITADQFVDDQEVDFEESERQDTLTVPRVVHLNYFDVEGGLATDKQSSERPGDRRSIGESSLTSAVMMDADEAAQVVEIQHKVGIEELRGLRKFSLADNHIGLTVTDNALVEWDGAYRRLRIVSCDVMDGYQRYTAVHDRQSCYTSDVEGIPAAPQTSPPSSVVGATLLQPLDIHILRDADDVPGLIGYVAVAGTLPAWRGARVEISHDGGENYVESFDITAASVMGTLSSSLADHPYAYPDETNSFSVQISTYQGTLDETDLAGMLNGQNLAIVGDELIQFANAEETSEGVWDLSYLLRGRKGSTTSSHEIGERFVLLRRSSLLALPANLTDIGRTLTFRATSYGGSVDDATVVSLTYTGRSQTERRPAYLQVWRDGDTLTCTWQGVGRVGSGARVALGDWFKAYRVTFSDGDDSIVVETKAHELVQDVSTLAAPVIVSVQQINKLTGAGPSIEVSA